MRNLFEKFGEFKPVKNMTRIVFAKGGKALLVTPDSMTVEFDKNKRGEVEYKEFFLGIMPDAWKFWSGKWTQFFVPVWVN